MTHSFAAILLSLSVAGLGACATDASGASPCDTALEHLESCGLPAPSLATCDEEVSARIAATSCDELGQVASDKADDVEEGAASDDGSAGTTPTGGEPQSAEAPIDTSSWSAAFWCTLGYVEYCPARPPVGPGEVDPNGSLSGRLLFEDGSPASGHWLHVTSYVRGLRNAVARNENSPTRRATVDSAGAYVAADLPVVAGQTEVLVEIYQGSERITHRLLGVRTEAHSYEDITLRTSAARE